MRRLSVARGISQAVVKPSLAQPRCSYLAPAAPSLARRSLNCEELKNELIPQIVAGELQGAFAFVERQSRYSMSDVKTQSTPSWRARVLTSLRE